MKKIILGLISLVILMSNIFSPSAIAQEDGLTGSQLDEAIIESIAYDQSTGLFVLEEEKATELGMSYEQVTNLSEFLNALDYEDTETLINLTGGSREQLDNATPSHVYFDSTYDIQPNAVITSAMVISALKNIGTGSAMAVVRAITNYGMASACKNTEWRSQFKIFNDFCSANGW
ncbi:hypothetical protein M0R79_05380 [Ignavigranum ruoffiae]|uniref:hypothetical protein n=1 Tax=Ignavigranum ruoffiae TaxID=89093 RepID=UPI00205AB118|nr:hypothetical protein [Ignavigranum ruoffiae]UPQ85110.1 hypothetical protein M0R79_05380 [Ignavigranum ruoffiae]